MSAVHARQAGHRHVSFTVTLPNRLPRCVYLDGALVEQMRDTLRYLDRHRAHLHDPRAQDGGYGPDAQQDAQDARLEITQRLQQFRAAIEPLLLAAFPVAEHGEPVKNLMRTLVREEWREPATRRALQQIMLQLIDSQADIYNKRQVRELVCARLRGDERVLLPVF